MLRLFALLSLILFLNPAYAQNEESPIIALHAGAIYAVNPHDGSAEMLVPASDAYGEVYEPASLFSSEWLSPDGQYLAYRMTYPINPSEPVTETTNKTQRLFILDLQGSGFPDSISLSAIASYELLSLAWSPDGNFLYVLIEIAGEEALKLFILEREHWQNQTTIEIAPSEDILKRNLLAIENAVVLQERPWMFSGNAMTVFNNEGEEINRFALTEDYAALIDFYVTTPMTPLLVEGQSYYSLINSPSTEIRYQIDFLSSEVTEFASGYAPAMISRANPENSLRVSPASYDGLGMALLIRDAEGNVLGDTPELRYQAFGPEGDSAGSTFALSPDGQSFAYIVDGQLMLWEDGESRDLGFSADVLVWAAPLYVPVYDPEYFGD